MDGNNRFGPQERAMLFGVKGVGPTVIGRLEQLGYHTLAGLAEADTTHIVHRVASMLGSTCWQNSPLARSAIDGAIALARAHLVVDAVKGVNG
ncbi:helix-hairpin-helix domain-containing protein [Aeromonas veronii]|uniref:Pathogenicity locus n=1 Tax=Aeromonas veronii TaxID=654 RepID=UPI0005A79318|nr:Pathogenicity locus [Aeromonas veronii]